MCECVCLCVCERENVCVSERRGERVSACVCVNVVARVSGGSVEL